MSIFRKILPMNKAGQGMWARWVAFLILIILFAWCSYSVYQVLYTYVGWQAEIPDPNVDITQAEPCPVPDCVDPQTGKQTIIPAGEAFCPVCGYQRNGSGIPWAAAVAVFLFIFFFWLSWRISHGRKGSEVLIETEQELRKVVWPSKVQVVNSSIVVVLSMIAIAAVLFVADVAINLLIRDILQLW